MIAVRHARTEEAPAIAAAYDWLFAPPGGPVAGWDRDVAAERLRSAMAGDRSAVLITEGLTGFCTVYLDVLSVRFGQRAWVEDLAVHPQQRSGGAGAALLDAAKRWAKARGASHLELDSGNARTDAHRFYAREGMTGGSTSFRIEL
jgi:GNAT superfamily N-acetyltransferase